MQDISHTQFFQVQREKPLSTDEIIKSVCEAMVEKGYDPLNQIVGYIMSGDPTYITSHKGARNLIMRMERDELVEHILQAYMAQAGLGRR